MANLKDVVESLKTIDTTLKKPVKKDSSDIEREQEAGRDAKESKQIQKDILATLKAGVGGAVQADKKQGGLIAGLLGGIGAGIGSIGKAVSSIGPKFIVGMGSIALGIGAFMLGLGGAGKIAELAGFDGKNLKNLVENTIGAFGATDLIVLAAVFGAAMLLEKKKTSKAGIILGMGAIGVGIGTFLLALGGAGKIAELSGFDGKSLKALVENTIGAFSGTDLVLLGAVFGAAMLLETTKATKKGVILGMGAIGAGIGTFLLALGGAGKIAELSGFDGKNLKTLVENTIGAFGATDLVVLAAIMGAAMGIEKAKATKVGVVLGMGAIGAGIAAFTLGILLADGFSTIGALLGLDGKSLKKLLGNFFEAFQKVGVAPLVALITAGALAGAIPGGEVAVVKGMTAIGAGIAGFSIGLLAAEGFATLGQMLGLDGSALKVLLSNVGEGIGGFIGGIGKGVFEQLQDLDADKLTQLGKGIAGIGIGIAAFGAGTAIGVVGGVVGALGSFFGVKSPIDTIIELSKDKDIDTKRLAELGGALEPLGKGIANFAGFELSGGFFGGDTDLEAFVKAIAKIGSSDVKIDAGKIKTIGDALLPLGKGMSGFKGIDFENLDDIDDFFEGISAKNLSRAASPAQLIEVSKGIAPLAESMKSFSGLDMDAITGGMGEDNLEKFFEGMATAAKEIKDPNKLVNAAVGIKALGEAMQSFKGIDGDQINKALAAVVEAGGNNKAIQIFTGSTQNALAGTGGGQPIIINNNNVDNSMQSSQTTAVSIPEPTRTNESTVRALQNS